MPLRVHLRVWEHADTSFPLQPYVQAPELGLMTSGIPAGTLVVPVHPSQVGDRFLKRLSACNWHASTLMMIDGRALQDCVDQCYHRSLPLSLG